MFLTNMIVCTAGMFFAMLASTALVISQASVAYETSILGVFAGPLVQIQVETFWGRMAAARFGLMLAYFLFVFLIVDRGEEHSSAKSFAAAVVCAAGALLTISLSSHAAAIPGMRLEATVNDYAHLIAAAIWIGGLAAIMACVSEIIMFANRAQLSELLGGIARRFSPIAAASVGLLGMTGLFSAWAQVGTFEALALPYGIALLAKTALVLVALALAAANLLWVKPRLADFMGESPLAAVRLRQFTRVEYVALALALLAVGYMAAMEPARQMAHRMGMGVESGISFEDTVEGARIHLNLDPGAVGPNTARITLTNESGDPITDATDVRLRLSYLDDDLGETAYSAANVDEGVYELDGQTIGIAGAWQAEVVAQRASAFDARTAFRFEIESGAADASRKRARSESRAQPVRHRVGNRRTGSARHRHTARRALHPRRIDYYGNGRGRRSRRRSPAVRSARRRRWRLRTEPHSADARIHNHRIRPLSDELPILPRQIRLRRRSGVRRHEAAGG